MLKKWKKTFDKATRQTLRKRCFGIDVIVGNQGDLQELGKGEFDQLLTNIGNGTFIASRLPAGPTGMVRDLVTGKISLKPGAPTTTGAVALADVDGDGDLDVFVANHGFLDPTGEDPTIRAGESSVLLFNQGNGTFTADALDGPRSVRNSTSVAAGDLDRDGDIDFLVTADGNPVRMYTNKGKGKFTVSDVTAGFSGLDYRGNPVVFAKRGPATKAPLRSLHVALGDLNGDRFLDALVVHDGDPNQVLINNRNGTFTARFIGGTELLDAEAVAIADLDGDGDLDGLVTYDGDGAALVRNDSAGNFTVEPIEGTEGKHSKAVVIGDFDDDGDFDAIVANTTAADSPVVEYPQLLRNRGNGTFWVRNVGRATRGETAVAADFDRDGDLDVIIGNVTIFGVDTPVHPNYMLRNDGLNAARRIVFTPVTVAGGPRVTDGLAAGEVHRHGIRPAVDDGLPNIDPDDLLPEMFPRKRQQK